MNFPMQVLMVAEKPSIARTIAQALSNQVQSQRKRTNHEVHYFPQMFFQMPCYIKVTSVVGHIFSTDFKPEYNGNDVDPIKLFDAPTIKKFSSPSPSIINHLEQEAQGCNYIVLWLDNDREGENICFEVLNICEPYMNIFDRSLQYVFRAKFSSITQVDIQNAFYQLHAVPDLNQSLAVDARQILDLKKKISYGPCQTPTLAFCVERHDEIQKFKPQTYYSIQLNLNNDVQVEWSGQEIYDLTVAQKIRDDIQKHKTVKVKKVESFITIRSKPVGLNTVNLLKVASRKYELGPQETMHTAESLYLQGFITYPRTETTKYSNEFDFKSVLQAISGSKFQKLSNYANFLINQGYTKSNKGVDAGDHPPITPTQNTPGQLNPNQQKIYDLVCKNFMGSLSKDVQIQNNTSQLEVGDNQFFLKQTNIINNGYFEIVSWESFNESYPDKKLYELNQEIPIEKVDIQTLLTQSPSYLSESDLIGLMENNGIGTDASMSQHINNIILRKYVKVQIKDRQLIPTELGIALIHAYKDIDPELVAPELRKKIEEQISQIAKGQMTKEQLLDTQLTIFKKKYENFTAQSSRLDYHFDLIKEFIGDFANQDEEEENNQNKEDDQEKRPNQYQQQYKKYNNNNNQFHQQQYGGYKQQNNRNNQKQQYNSNQGYRYYKKEDGNNNNGNNNNNVNNNNSGNRQNNQNNKGNNNTNYNNRNNNVIFQQQFSDQQFPNIMEQLDPARMTEQKKDPQKKETVINAEQQSQQQDKSINQNEIPNQKQEGYQKKRGSNYKNQQNFKKEKKQYNNNTNTGGEQQQEILAVDCIEHQLQNLKFTKKKGKKTIQNNEEDQQNQQQ